MDGPHPAHRASFANSAFTQAMTVAADSVNFVMAAEVQEMDLQFAGLRVARELEKDTKVIARRAGPAVLQFSSELCGAAGWDGE